MIALEKYAKIKNNYCLGYFGACNEYLVQLRLLKPILEQRFPGINIHLSCKDECSIYLDKCVPLSDVRQKISEFAHIKELKYNGQGHPISVLLEECDIKQYAIPTCPPESHTSLCVIVTKGVYPTSHLVESQIDTLSKIAKEKGYDVEVDRDWQSAGMVYGVESVALFEAASRGLETKLVPTGIGSRLYENMFPDGEILRI